MQTVTSTAAPRITSRIAEDLARITYVEDDARLAEAKTLMAEAAERIRELAADAASALQSPGPDAVADASMHTEELESLLKRLRDAEEVACDYERLKAAGAFGED